MPPKRSASAAAVGAGRPSPKRVKVSAESASASGTQRTLDAFFFTSPKKSPSQNASPSREQWKGRGGSVLGRPRPRPPPQEVIAVDVDDEEGGHWIHRISPWPPSEHLNERDAGGAGQVNRIPGTPVTDEGQRGESRTEEENDADSGADLLPARRPEGGIDGIDGIDVALAQRLERRFRTDTNTNTSGLDGSVSPSNTSRLVSGSLLFTFTFVFKQAV